MDLAEACGNQTYQTRFRLTAVLKAARSIPTRTQTIRRRVILMSRSKVTQAESTRNK